MSMKRSFFLLFFMCSALFAVYAQQVTFTPQWTPQSQFAGYYAALEKGFYAQEGVDVNIVHPTKTYSSVNMLLDGSADIITGELIQAMEAAGKNISFVNLMQTTQHSTLVLLTRKENVSSIMQLRGCRIGTWKVGFNEIPRMLELQQNLGIEWIKFINPVNLYISGAVDATLAKSYNEKILFSMSGITPGSVLHFSEMGFDFPEDGLYVTEDFYKKNTGLCRKFARASQKGWEWVRNNREEALEIVMKYVKAENVPTNIYNQKLMLDVLLDAQEDVKGQAPSYKLSEDAFNRLNSKLVQYGIIPKPVEFKRFMGGDL